MNSQLRTQGKTLATLAPYLWPRGALDVKARVVLALAALAMAKVANVWVPLFYKDAVDTLSELDPSGLTGGPAYAAIPIGLLLAYGGARVLSVVFQELREILFARVAQRTIRTVALKTFQHLHALSLRFHLDRQTGGLSRVIERGVKGIEFVLSFMLFNIIPTLLEILMVCAVLWGLFNFWFAAITLTTIVSYIAYTLIVTEWRLKFRRRMNEEDAQANTKAIDSLLNYETVKYFSAEAHEADRYDRSLQGYERAAVRSISSLSVVNIGQGLIISTGLVAVMALAASGYVSGEMTIGDFVLVNTYMIQLFLPLNFLGFVYRQIRQSLTDMEDMFSMLDIEKEVTDAPGATPLSVKAGRVEFDHVDFGYDPRRPILKDVSFTVEPGSTVAIVGPSGAGKSTISRLLFRFYDVTYGAIRIDGQDLRDATQDSIRRALGIVPQDTVLFNDSVRYNIAYGGRAADATGAAPGESAVSEADIERAARLAHIDGFIRSLPDGYDTVVGERGLKLSGGEKQRVAIARTIVKNPPILLFDEATSALDTATEREIQANLREVSKDRTALVIAHRLSTVVDADEILVLEGGRIVERGGHQALLAQDGVYATMWRRQQEQAQRGEDRLSEE
ncbi:MAG: ABC transporter ATP-binding protein/permease [Alphaproteobacteria bacterium]|nr:ABC transporter ATP-binding protein/permease [Alphaproteobacteria bacterium]